MEHEHTDQDYPDHDHIDTDGVNELEARLETEKQAEEHVGNTVLAGMIDAMTGDDRQPR
jgi:hypothetical protein